MPKKLKRNLPEEKCRQRKSFQFDNKNVTKAEIRIRLSLNPFLVYILRITWQFSEV